MHHMQRLADKASSGFFNGPVDAKIQGPYDGHNMAGYEIDAYTQKLVLCGGVGIAAVLPMLKRMALRMEYLDKTATGLIDIPNQCCWQRFSILSM